MGFLDHSTNNIIVDAVLTDEGRKALARNDGSFQIRMFSLGDDEVDYTLIQKFGRSVGKEKISKNTPVFEAQTQAGLAIKNRLITLPNRRLTTMPILEVARLEDGDPANAITANGNITGVGLHIVNGTTATVQLRQKMKNNNLRVPDGLYDSTYTITVPDRFITISGLNRVSVTNNTRIATYRKVAVGNAGEGGGSLMDLGINLRTLDDTHFDVFSTAHDSNRIDSIITVVGDQSGLRKSLQLQIKRN